MFDVVFLLGLMGVFCRVSVGFGSCVWFIVAAGGCSFRSGYFKQTNSI